MSGWIYSDFAYLAGGSPDGRLFEAPFGEPYATDGDGDEEKALERLASPRGHKIGSRRYLTWHQMAHNPELAGSNPARYFTKAQERGLRDSGSRQLTGRHPVIPLTVHSSTWRLALRVEPVRSRLGSLRVEKSLTGTR
jgi:hypothetical protein